MSARRCKLAALIVAVVIAGCSAPSPRSTPAFAEAQGFLAQIVKLAQRGDFAGLCALGDHNCERSLDEAGRNAVPPLPPSIVDTRVVPTTESGGQTSIGGLVLVLCGKDATGAAYRSETLVFQDGSGLRAINPVYWDNTTIASGMSTPVSPRPSATC